MHDYYTVLLAVKNSRIGHNFCWIKVINSSDKTYSLVKVQTKNTIQLTKLTEVLCREKKRSDDLIYKLVPADIAKKLKNHIAVTPEIFDSVSGYFSMQPIYSTKHLIHEYFF